MDGSALQRAYLSRAAAIHPDLAVGDEHAEVRSAVLNRAKAVLEDPERRANELLARLGGPGKSEDKSLPAGFLMSMMETREAIEEALASKDAEARVKWEAWAQEQRDEYKQRVGGLFGGIGESRDAGTLRSDSGGAQCLAVYRAAD